MHIFIFEYYISSKDADGQTVLHYAAKVGNIKCVKMLLEHGADIAVSVSVSVTDIV